MDKHDILIVSKSDDNSIYVTTKGDIFEIAAAIKAITGGIVHHTMENRGKSDARNGKENINPQMRQSR